MFDPRRREYAIFCRPRWSRGGPDPRAVARIPSKDLIHWGPEHIILQTDDRDAPAHGRRELPTDADAAGESVFTRGRELQFYGFTPAVYQDMYIGFALVYDTHARKSWQELVHSYDGIDWIREPRREPFITSEPDTWNAGGVYFMAKGCPVEIDDHYYFYVTAMNTLHGWQVISMKDQGKIRWIAAARIRKGRFVGYATGVHDLFKRTAAKRKIPPYWRDRGMLMTRPFTLDCERVFLNAKVEEGGSIAVEVRKGVDLPTAASPYPLMEDYGKENANPIRNADGLKLPVTFKNTSLKPLRGESVRLLLHLEKATVYGLSFE